MKLIFVLFVTIYYFTLITSKNDYDWWYINNSCTTSEPSIVSSLNCGLSKNIKRRTQQIEVKFAQDITQWYMNLKMVLPRKPHDFVVLNLTKIDGCQLLGNKNQVTLMQLARATLERYSNLPMHCPLRKDILYYIRGYHISMESLPSFGFETDIDVWYEIIVQKKTAVFGYSKSHIGLKYAKKRRN